MAAMNTSSTLSPKQRKELIEAITAAMIEHGHVFPDQAHDVQIELLAQDDTGLIESGEEFCPDQTAAIVGH